MSDIPYPDTPLPDIPAPPLPDFPAPLPEVEPDPSEEPDLPPEPSEPPGDDVPTASGAASPPASAVSGVWWSGEVQLRRDCCSERKSTSSLAISVLILFFSASSMFSMAFDMNRVTASNSSTTIS